MSLKLMLSPRAAEAAFAGASLVAGDCLATAGGARRAVSAVIGAGERTAGL
jgi:hypothetical protein